IVTVIVVVTSGQIDSNNAGPSTLNSAASLSSSNYAGFSASSSSFVANGFNPSESSSVNIPLVVGIAVPVAGILIIIIVVVIVKVKGKANVVK
ncbi:MAG: hypothetical protein ACKO96_25055, partial [Flammeovirgaceae bacterium]